MRMMMLNEYIREIVNAWETLMADASYVLDFECT